MYDPIVYTRFYVKRCRTVWFGAIKVNKLSIIIKGAVALIMLQASV